MKSNREFLLQFVKGWKKKSKGIHYTLTPNHLYLHDKKKLHKSKIIWSFSMDEAGISSRFSDDGGETWKFVLTDGLILLKQ